MISVQAKTLIARMQRFDHAASEQRAQCLAILLLTASQAAARTDENLQYIEA